MLVFYSPVQVFEMKNRSKKKRQATIPEEPWYIIHI